jgi:hypothetical protein
LANWYRIDLEVFPDSGSARRYFAHGTALIPASAAISANSNAFWISVAPVTMLITTG